MNAPCEELTTNDFMSIAWIPVTIYEHNMD